jgi:ABC-type branched-subunit amino acid transport system substrate-binding protein
MDQQDFGDRVFTLAADYSWGHDLSADIKQFTEESGREFLGEVRTPFGASDMTDFLASAQNENPDVLFLIHYGTDNATAIEQAVSMGLHEEMEIVSPLALITATRAVSPESLQHIYAANNWYHGHDNERSQSFAEDFNDRVGRYPSDLAQTAYKNTFLYLDTVQELGTKNSEEIINEIEGKSYKYMKGQEHVRAEDHLNEQGYFLLEGKAPEDREYEEDHFEVIELLSRNEVTPDPTGGCDLDTVEDV